MKRLLLVSVAAALLLPGAARPAACSPLSCGPSQFSLAGGSLLAYRAAPADRLSVVDLRGGESFTLPSGVLAGNVLVHQEGRGIEWYEASTGRKTADRVLPWKGRLAGASQDGSRAVVFRSKRSLAIVTPRSLRLVALAPGNWDFDALRNGDLYLIRYDGAGGYQVRLLDLAHPSAPTRLLKDPHESGTIWGQPFSRLTSADGRFVFTLYVAGNGASMIHQLDLRTRRARCIDLPGTGDYGSAATWGLTLSSDGRTLWAVGPGYGRIVAVDVASRKVANAFRVSLDYWAVGRSSQTALSPDGSKVAFANGEELAVVDLAARRVVRRFKSRAIAVAYTPSGELRLLP
jgi:hypothetical protein